MVGLESIVLAVFPAHAGMNRWSDTRRAEVSSRVPCTRGDEPFILMVGAPALMRVPCTRGDEPVTRMVLLP